MTVYKPVYWTSKYLSDKERAKISFEWEKMFDYKKDARKKWYILCRWKGYSREQDKPQPVSSFIHWCTDSFIRFLKKHADLDGELSGLKDCVTKKDLQVQEEVPMVARTIPNKTRAEKKSLVIP